ncbi:neurogenic locus notch homolog protein 2-like isoform X2 [Crassostrea angulata]|uniref:neurogenic locus notch homolog protein 2-like isoform X2 n=1 Tax=Magallana angulata TaxID=2784310 RepID=UPI0022B1ABBF|nr:neurogenic locus notch homolog protein 2-like isoform X2 [Crassostrea angulata]
MNAIFFEFVFVFTFQLTTSFIAQRSRNTDGCGEAGIWTVYNSQCYQCINDTVSWQTARSSCQQLGADLVTIKNAGTQNFTENLCVDARHWIGLNDISEEGNFFWVATSMQATYLNWNPGEPNGLANENCVHLFASIHTWNDLDCTANLSYICQKDQDFDECVSSPCVHGTCTDQLHSYTCHCQPGYTGTNCETDVDECQSSPCIHGNCSDLINEYRCQCLPGYDGLQCQIDVDECQSSPCIHCNCSDLVNEYSCQCFPGYEGLQCQKVNTLLLFILFTFLPIIMLVLTWYLSKRINHNKVEDDLDIFVFPDVLREESKPKLFLHILRNKK